MITRIDPYQAQLLNRFRRGSMLVPGETMLVLECAPAAYINYACNEAEKTASIKLMHVSSVGRFGRMWLSGTEAEILTARDAAIQALESLEGQGRRLITALPGWIGAIMPKEFYTETDIEDMVKRGVMSLEVNDNVVLTDLAYEKASRLGVRLVRKSPDQPPSAPVRPYISQKRRAPPARRLRQLSCAPAIAQ